MSDHDFVPLDPNEGPTAWVKAQQSDTSEYAHVVFVSGGDPTDPHNKILLNASEMETAISVFRSEVPPRE